MKDLLEAGVHFGHQTKRWNPKMKPYIFGERSGIYILDLGKTVKMFKTAEQFVRQLAAEGKTVLFVGTKRQAQDVIAEEAARSGMYYVNERWLGGLLTNFTTIQRSIARLRDLEAMATDGRYEFMPKKEIARAEKEKRKLLKNLEGIRNMSRLPDALFVVDTRKEKIAVDEARKLKIPVIGIVDTNCDPDEVDFAIPGNDDALRSIRLFAARMADVILDGRGERESAIAEQAQAEAEAAAADDASRTVRPANLRRPQRPTKRRRRSRLSPTTSPVSPPAAVWAGVFYVPDGPASRPGIRRIASHPIISRGDGASTPGHTATSRNQQQRDTEMANDHSGSSKATAREDWRGHDGLQDSADRGRGRCRQGRRPAPQEGPRVGGEARRPSGQGRHDRSLHPHGWQGGRARRSELRNGFRGAHRGFPGRSPRSSRSTSRRPIRATSNARTSPATSSNARRRSTGRNCAPGKKPEVIDKIIEGKLESYYAQVCLMDQPSVRDPNVSIKQMIINAAAKTGENVTVSGSFASSSANALSRHV